MPPVGSVQRQSAKPVTSNGKKPPPKSLDTDDILGGAIDIADLPDDVIRMVLYGQNRVGKSTLAALFPKPLLVVAFEPNASGGQKSIKKTPEVTAVRITSKGGLDYAGRVQKDHGKSTALKLVEQLKKNNPFKTVVLDTVTSLQDLILQELLDLPNVPEQMAWGTVSKEQYQDRSEQTRETLRPFTNLPVNLIMVAKEKDHNPPQEGFGKKLTRREQPESFFAASLGGATVDWLHDVCDYICRLYHAKEYKYTRIENPDGSVTEIPEETGRIVRRLRTMYHPNYAAGFRSENPGVVPEYIEADKPEEFYQAVMDVIAGRKTPKGYYQQ